MTDAIFVNGTVGVGKSTLADALSATETVAHAVIDLDAIRRFNPAPRADRINHELELQNLRSIAHNYRDAGARRFIVAGVLEDASEIPRYIDALASEGLFICRLVARPEVVESRLRARHAADPGGLAWHLRRVGELAQILDERALDHMVLDSSDTPATDLALAVRRAVNWTTPATTRSDAPAPEGLIS